MKHVDDEHKYVPEVVVDRRDVIKLILAGLPVFLLAEEGEAQTQNLRVTNRPPHKIKITAQGIVPYGSPNGQGSLPGYCNLFFEKRPLKGVNDGLHSFILSSAGSHAAPATISNNNMEHRALNFAWRFTPEFPASELRTIDLFYSDIYNVPRRPQLLYKTYRLKRQDFVEIVITDVEIVARFKDPSRKGIRSTGTFTIKEARPDNDDNVFITLNFRDSMFSSLTMSSVDANPLPGPITKPDLSFLAHIICSRKCCPIPRAG